MLYGGIWFEFFTILSIMSNTTPKNRHFFAVMLLKPSVAEYELTHNRQTIYMCCRKVKQSPINFHAHVI